ncbi:MAG: hypothetical protein ACYDBH_17115 [Acidobacteriaceae bacterium]
MIKKWHVIRVAPAGPAIWLVAYAVYWGRDYNQATWGISIPPLMYMTIVVIAVVGTTGTVAETLIEDLKTEAKKRKEQQRQ